MARSPAPSNPLVAHCVELFAPLGPVRTLRMFGGHGFYVDGLFMALLARDDLFLKADAEAQPAFEAAGSQPFAFTTKDGQRTVLSYWRAPDEAMESPEAMRHWARMAMGAALRAANAKPAAKRAAKPAAAPPKKRPDNRPTHRAPKPRAKPGGAA